MFWTSSIRSKNMDVNSSINSLNGTSILWYNCNDFKKLIEQSNTHFFHGVAFGGTWESILQLGIKDDASPHCKVNCHVVSGRVNVGWSFVGIGYSPTCSFYSKTSQITFSSYNMWLWTHHYKDYSSSFSLSKTSCQPRT